ncbi:MAG: 30S ribosomal protein S9 [Halobacteria archaeon]
MVEVGRRRSAIARATVRKGAGRVLVNSRPLAALGPEMARLRMEEPLRVAASWNPSRMAETDVRVRVEGGGYQGQADATRTAIARSLERWFGDEALTEALLAHDRKILVSDHRRKWPKHFGGPGARAKKQKSYR